MVAGGRATNDYRRRAFGHQAQRVIAFVCECSDEQCRRTVLLTAEEFDEARTSRRPIVVDATHVRNPHSQER